MKLKRCVVPAVVLAAVTFTAASADTIELKDGRRLSGSIARQGDVMVIKTDDGKVVSAKPDDVVRVTLTGSLSPAEAAAAEWKRLALQIKSADNLQTILDLHRQFLTKYPESTQADDVRSSQEVYQKLSENGGVKFRGRWMPRAQVEVLMKQWADDARTATDLYRAGRLKETLESIKTVLVADNQNPDALTVAGLAAYRLNLLPQANSYFTALAAADPGSVLAENNLAVVLNLQKQPGGSLVHYEKALEIAPDNRVLLDNIAEALNAYAGDKNAANYRNLVRQFEPAETRMEVEMAKKGLQRWGATWVTKEQLEAQKKNQAAVEAQMARLDAQYQNVRAAINNLEMLIRQASASYQQYQGDYNVGTAQVALFLQAHPLPQPGTDIKPYTQGESDAYYAMITARDVAWQNMSRVDHYRSALVTQRNQIVQDSAAFFAEAEKLKAKHAATLMTYTGVQRILDLGEQENPPPVPAAGTMPASATQPAGSAPVIVLPKAPSLPAPPEMFVPVPTPVNPARR